VLPRREGGTGRLRGAAGRSRRRGRDHGGDRETVAGPRPAGPPRSGDLHRRRGRCRDMDGGRALAGRGAGLPARRGRRRAGAAGLLLRERPLRHGPAGAEHLRQRGRPVHAAEDRRRPRPAPGRCTDARDPRREPRELRRLRPPGRRRHREHRGCGDDRAGDRGGARDRALSGPALNTRAPRGRLAVLPSPHRARSPMPEPVPSAARHRSSERAVRAEDKSSPACLLGRPITALDAPLSDFSTPLLVLDEQAMAHNLQVMADWTAERGLELMPHGETTMAPVLWRRQLAAGCTGITLATGWQADLALRAGIPTAQLANACADPALLRRLAAHLAAHPEQELVCWADSLSTIDLLERELPPGSRLGVLVELGADGARTGARDEATAREIAERVAASGVLELRGAAGYEGALAHDRSPEALEAVSTYCRRLAAFAESLRPLIDATPWVSAGGSAYFDLVADAFAPLTDMRAIL